MKVGDLVKFSTTYCAVSSICGIVVKITTHQECPYYYAALGNMIEVALKDGGVKSFPASYLEVVNESR